MWKVRPAHSCFGCLTLTMGVEATCFLSLLVQIAIISVCSSAEPLSVLGLKVSPQIQVLSASWALAGIPVVIAAAVGVLYHVDHLLRTFFWYLLISFLLGISVPFGLLLSGRVCDSVVEDEVQRLGSAFVCGFTESFVFMWTTVAALLHAYLVYVVWSAAEEITEMTYNSVALSAYSNKLQFMASMAQSAAPEAPSVPVMTPGVATAYAHQPDSSAAAASPPEGGPQSFFPAPTSGADFRSAASAPAFGSADVAAPAPAEGSAQEPPAPVEKDLTPQSEKKPTLGPTPQSARSAGSPQSFFPSPSSKMDFA